MYGRSETPGQWSVYAEFTISHPGSGDPDNVPRTRTEQNDNSVRMTYSWNSQQNNQTAPAAWVPSETASSYSENRPDPSYGFQKGNLVFTSTPPPRRPTNLPGGGTRLQESSGYGSNLLSPSSISSGQNTKCRSTCNITLGSQYQCHHHHHCGRTQSLRCQTPSSRSDLKNAYYGCGDPWCHHLRSGEDVSVGGRCSPVQEACEECSSLNGRSTCKPATRSLSRELDGRKDVSVQTFEMVDKCTSPFLREDAKEEKKRSRRVRRRSSSSQRRKAEVSPSSFTPDSLEGGPSQVSCDGLVIV